ncbi:MAG: hybrid sensor histidine kinase/response regulator [Spirochaetaceae bacterium]|nr:MAG: hybrid sensor histidine kinase/response regulator [Spirochaetaceae bacterium]
MSKAGYKVDTVENGAQAVQALQTFHYDLVLMDCQMPIMDGYEATRTIRNSSPGNLNKDVPIIAMTAYAMKGDREKCLNCGMNDYLPKPMHAEKVLKTIEAWLTTGSASETSANQTEDHLEDQNDLGKGQKVYDRNDILERLMQNEAMVQRLIERYRESIPLQLLDLRQAISDRDIKAAAQAAHILAGSGANISCKRLHAAGLELEEVLDDLRESKQQEEDIWGAIERLQKEISNIIDQLVSQLDASTARIESSSS